MVALRAALLCERVLQEVDGVASAIRIFDSIALPAGGTMDAMLFVVLVNTEPADSDSHLILVQIESSEGQIVSRAALEVKSPLAAGQSFELVVPFRVEAPPKDETRWLQLAFDTEDQYLTRFPLHFAVAAAPTSSE